MLTTYVAFLRGINVGGKKLIKMEELARAIGSLGLKNVRTFIQSGNVIFDTAEPPDALTKRIERKILKSFGHEVPVVLLTLNELERIVKSRPFKKIKAGEDVMLFVAFLAAEPAKPKLPWQSAADNVELLAIKERAAYIVCHRKKNGLFAFPNNSFEQQYGVAATTRNWTTVSKLVVFARPGETT